MSRLFSTFPILLLCMSFFVMPSEASFFSGSRANMMGGAFTAVSDDASAIFWNPAGIVLIPHLAVELIYGDGVDASEKMSDLLSSIDDNNPTGEFDPEILVRDLTKLGKYECISRGGGNLGFALGFPGLALSIRGIDILYAQPLVDPAHLNADPTVDDYVGNSDSRVQFSGFQIKEYGFTYGWISQSRSVAFGITGKYMDITGYCFQESLWNLTNYEPADFVDHVTSGAETTEGQWNADVGFLMIAGKNRFGVVGRNLDEIRFEADDATELKIAPEYRIGYAFFPAARTVISVDYSLSKETDPRGDKMDGKDIAMGFETKIGKKNLFIIRAGSMLQLESDDPVMFTGGIGFDFSGVILDAGFGSDQYGESRKIWAGLHLVL